MVGVYKIKNLITGDFYIGQSKNIKKRIQHHKDSSVHSEAFERDIQEYGWDAFSVEILEECEEKDLLEREAYYIAELSPRYNSIVRGRKIPPETREKISKSLKGTHQPAEVIERRKASIAETRKLKPQTNRGHMKRIQADMMNDTHPIATFESVKAAAEFFGVSPSTVTKALKRGGTVHGHKVWYEV